MSDLNPADLISPPSWSLTVGLIGRTLVYLSAALFLVSGASWFASKRLPGLQKVGSIAFNLGCAAILGTLVSLGVLFANNRFEYEYVFGHADTKNALAYRIAGIWSGQEGSFLLWASCSAIFALLTVGGTGIYRRWYSIAFAFFLGGITSILAFESPFNLNLVDGKPFVPADGVGLAPSLQNYWVIIHPPTIFLGFGSLTVLFALAFAAMAERKYEGWIPIVRPWAIVAVTLVGLGLCMGGFWAYETLGWGGFWMWDPVENVSFVPWCFGAAFMHGVLVQVTKKKWQMSNLLLGGLPFLAFIYGTFLTRSGFLSETSVHSFAEMDRSALKLLIALLAISVGGFAGLWGYRLFQERRVPKPVPDATPVRREAFYVMGIAALITLGVATMIGMSVPLVQALRGDKPRVVEEGLYHQVLPWIFIPLMILMAITPFVAWNGMKGRELLSKVYSVFCVAIGVTGLALFITVVTPFARKIEMSPTVLMLGRYEVKGLAWIMVLFGICIFVLVANTWRITDIFRRSKMGAASFGAHIGVAVLMAGLIVSRGLEQRAEGFVMKDVPAKLLAYEIRYGGMTSDEHDRNNKLKLHVYDPHTSKQLFTAFPGVYKLETPDGQTNTMVWPHIERGPLMDTYISLGQPQTDISEDFTLAPGQSTDFQGMVITYKKMTRSGDFGAEGTKFGALVTVSNGAHAVDVNPTMELGDLGKTIMNPAKIDNQLQVAIVGMNAADKSVTLRMQLTSPMYPIEVFHKPMTTLVWAGTGILTISGFAAAAYRRVRRSQPAKTPLLERPGRTPELGPAFRGETT
ncbi:MAG: hypothetical protein HONBIEJF_02627 [Fimbriimonadaceae bacterium]|nr:hypothetical protein [Fimbriimonadaceae bacterium]